MNPNVGLFEINSILQMSDDDFEEYLQSAVIHFCQSHAPMPPHVFRALLILLRYSDEEGDLKERQGKGEDTEGHIASRDQTSRPLGNHRLPADWVLSIVEKVRGTPGNALRAPQCSRSTLS